MEKKLDIKFLAVALLVNAVSLIIIMALGALIGIKTESPQTITMPIALVSVAGAGAVTGIVCARFAPSAPMIYALICALTITLIICLASLANSGGTSWVRYLIPVLSFASPLCMAYIATPKNSSKRKLKHLGVKV